MRLLIESPNCNAFAGSNGAVGFGWVSNLARRHEVHVVVYDGRFEEGGAPPLDNVVVHRVEPTRAARLGTMTDFVTTAARMRRRLLDDVRPDVVHSIEPSGWPGARSLATDRVPYVLGPLTGGTEPPRAFANAVLESLPVSPARALVRGGPRKLAVSLLSEAMFGTTPSARALGRAAMRRARRILVATPLSAGAIPPGLEARVIDMPLMGLDLSLFSPRETARGGATTVLYAGRIVPIKGLHLLIEAAARAGARVRVAGAAPREDGWYEVYCRARADALRARVEWLGVLSRSELAAEYARADVTCMLSLWDTYGLTYVESMACGTPVIGLAAGGAAAVIREGTGWLVQPSTPERVVADVAGILSDAGAEGFARAGRRARAHTEREFDWESLLDRIDRIYERIA